MGDAPELNKVSSLNNIRLIDFGFAIKYKDVPNTLQKIFKGNIVFASKHLFNLQTPSRRDDLISLGYVMLYMIDGDLPFIKDESISIFNPRQDQEQDFKRVKTLKNILTPADLCRTREGKLILPYLREVYSLEYEETPNYDKLAFLLVKSLLDLNMVPT